MTPMQRVDSLMAAGRAHTFEISARLAPGRGLSQYPFVLAAAGWWSDVDPDSIRPRPLALDIARRRREGLIR